jgi:hypothetical protein
MISCKLEQVGDRLALLLDHDAAAALDLHAGDTVRLDPGSHGLMHVTRELAAEDVHARGRAFLRRYHRSFTQLG